MPLHLAEQGDAAEQGLAKAQYLLGGMYANGYGVGGGDPQKNTEAPKWYRLAAAQKDEASITLIHKKVN